MKRETVSPYYIMGLFKNNTHFEFEIEHYVEKSLAWEAANEKYEQLVARCHHGFIEVDKPQWTGMGYYVSMFYSNEFHKALEYAKQGVYWNVESQSPNFQHTCEVLENEMRRERVDLKWFEKTFKSMTALRLQHPTEEAILDLITTMTLARLERYVISDFQNNKSLSLTSED